MSQPQKLREHDSKGFRAQNRTELLTVICEFKYGQSWNRGDLEQIKFLLGHSSIQTTERYLGSDQEIAIAVNDNLGL